MRKLRSKAPSTFWHCTTLENHAKSRQFRESKRTQQCWPSGQTIQGLETPAGEASWSGERAAEEERPWWWQGGAAEGREQKR